ncbi:MAG TPA: FGGY family carbohydrate kinase [Saprospiraceae bacterium]|nr:FGGY family carbohydrate kinase [Saprospiraceae bacterium]
MISLGIDLGSSSVKVSLVDTSTLHVLSSVKYPEREMKIDSPKAGWAEQDPKLWWDYVCKAINMAIIEADVAAQSVKSIGISYQMHGLVIVDKHGEPIRPSIIWCDSRAVQTGEILTDAIGLDFVQNNLLNNLGNFTASKLFWVKLHERHNFDLIHKVMLPGDFIAFKMSGAYTTTQTGMSEGIFYDFKNDKISDKILNVLDMDASKFPSIGGSFDQLASTNQSFEEATGIKIGTPIAYRAGDQPNNALSLGVLKRGEAAGTGGTSGVIYAVSGDVKYDALSRVNTFAHVNHAQSDPYLGTLLCINGTGILYNWVKSNFFADKSYNECEQIAQSVASGSEGVCFFPFGNGAERMFSNQLINSSLHGLDFNRHDKRHILRAGLEGIAFSFVYGLEILRDLGIELNFMKVGNDNLFQSQVFSQTLADVGNISIDVIETTGSVGAAIGSAYGAGLIEHLEDGFKNLKTVKRIEPSVTQKIKMEVYQNWKSILNARLRE